MTRILSRCAVGLLLLAAALPHAALASASTWIGNAHAAARLITGEAATGSATRLDAGLEIRLAPGWHAYWRTPGDAGVPPSVAWTGSDNIAAAEIAWPAPARLVVSGLQNAIYTGDVVLPIAIALARPGEPAHLHAELDYAACAEVCVPYHASLDLPVPAGLAQPTPEAGLIATARARVPGELGTARLRLVSALATPTAHGSTLSVTLASEAAPLREPDLFVEGFDEIAPGAPRVERGADATTRLIVALPGIPALKVAGRPLTLTVVDGDRAASFAAVPAVGVLPSGGDQAWLAILGIAMLGGLILNVMPCVLPVLSLKLLSVAAHAGEGRRTRAGLLATAGGVLASFGVLAAGLIALQAAGAGIGWGIQFQQPWFLAAMAVATALFAASLWDWLPIGLPGLSRVAGIQSRHAGLDAFLTGAFVTLLATPCSAPFVGTAVGFALSRGPAQIASVFAAMGLGMAAPYLLVAALPSLARALPRPGRWMGALRIILGLLLAGTAGWLLWVLAQVAGPVASLLAAAAVSLMLVLLAVRGRATRTGAAPRRGLAPAVAAAAGLAILAPAVASSGQQAAIPAAADALWQPMDTAAIAPLVAAGDVVFVDVTAAWCLTCKVNELGVLARAPVAGLLRRPGLVALRADWTRPDPAISAYLQGFGRYGVPLDVVYGPGRPGGVALPELLTTDAVSRAIADASGRITPQQAAR